MSLPRTRVRLTSTLCLTLFAILPFSFFASPASRAQTTDAAAAQKVADAAKQGFPMAVATDVTGNVSVEAVLIPPKIAREVFSGTVSSNYAVISLTISNHSKEASLIVHTIFMDYSRWLLSGNFNEIGGCLAVGAGTAANGASNGASGASPT